MRMNEQSIETGRSNFHPRTTWTATCLGACHKLLAQLRRVKEAILDEARATRTAQERLVRLALNEAEAEAWLTGYPQLVFPELAGEKVRNLTVWRARQQRIQAGQTLSAHAA